MVLVTQWKRGLHTEWLQPHLWLDRCNLFDIVCLCVCASFSQWMDIHTDLIEFGMEVEWKVKFVGQIHRSKVKVTRSNKVFFIHFNWNFSKFLCFVSRQHQRHSQSASCGIHCIYECWGYGACGVLKTIYRKWMLPCRRWRCYWVNPTWNIRCWRKSGGVHSVQGWLSWAHSHCSGRRKRGKLGTHPGPTTPTPENGKDY